MREPWRAIDTLRNLQFKDTWDKSSLLTNYAKKKANELYFKKLIKFAHFLTSKHLPLKELYLKMIKFLSGKINEP